MGAKAQHDPGYKRLCKRLREWRLGAKLSQRALAERLKKPYSYVFKSETGERRIDPMELSRWARACGVSPADVMDALDL